MSKLEYLSDPEKVSMSDDWFAFAKEDHFWMQWRLNALLKYKNILPKEGSLLLEIGCGNGVVINQLEKELNYIVDGCDLNAEALSIAHPSKGRKMVYNIFDLQPELLNKYDGILLLDVLEHITDDVTFLKTAAKYVKPGGIILINVPAHDWLYSKYDDEAGHVRRYNKQTLQQLIAASGMTTLKIEMWGLLLVPVALIRKIVLKRKDDHVIQTGFTPPNKLANRFLHLLKNIENRISFSLPSGTSVLAICKVPETI